MEGIQITRIAQVRERIKGRRRRNYKIRRMKRMT